MRRPSTPPTSARRRPRNAEHQTERNDVGDERAWTRRRRTAAVSECPVRFIVVRLENLVPLPVNAWMVALCLVASAGTASAQSPAGAADPGAGSAPAATVTCSSGPGERQSCAADTSAGVALLRSTGSATCLLGNNWGYDTTGVWVSDGCAGEFQLGQAAVTGSQAAAPPPVYEPIESWGEFTPGDGFLVGRSSLGSLTLSGYTLARYMNQMPGEQTFTDHLGNVRTVDGRNDIYSHR